MTEILLFIKYLFLSAKVFITLRVSFSAKTNMKDIKIFVKRMHEYFALTKKLKEET